MAPHALLRLPALLCLGSLPGCSFLFVDTPETVPADVQPKDVDCTSSAVAPVFDTVFGGLEAIRTGIALAADDSDYSDYPISRPADIGFGLGFTALFVSSAAYGFINTDECSDLQQRAAANRKAEPAAWSPPPAAAPPPPYAACTVDTQCKGDRICEGGRCVDPPAPALRSPVPIAPTPAPAAVPGTAAPTEAPTAEPPGTSAPAQPPAREPSP